MQYILNLLILGILIAMAKCSVALDFFFFVFEFQVLCWTEEENELERFKSRLSQLYYENLLKVVSLLS